MFAHDSELCSHVSQSGSKSKCFLLFSTSITWQTGTRRRRGAAACHVPVLLVPSIVHGSQVNAAFMHGSREQTVNAAQSENNSTPTSGEKKVLNGFCRPEGRSHDRVYPRRADGK